MDILTILILSVHEHEHKHGMFVYCVCSHMHGGGVALCKRIAAEAGRPADRMALLDPGIRVPQRSGRVK